MPRRIVDRTREASPRQLAGRYVLERELGHGGMAHVFSARDLTSNGVVAVKLLRRKLAGVVSIARFRREILYVGSLRHPHILPLLDSGEDSGDLFFTMPLVEGETLRARLARTGPLALADVYALVVALASALDYAHAHNIVHRDLKPENIMFDGDHVLLCDFGIARAIELAANEEALSSSGIAIGTPTYMSPEQALHDGPVDGRTDIYALGCVAYETLTGDPPFTGPTALSVMIRHATIDARPIRSVRPEVPAAFEEAIRDAMAKSPDARPSTGAEFAVRLASSLDPLG